MSATVVGVVLVLVLGALLYHLGMCSLVAAFCEEAQQAQKTAAGWKKVSEDWKSSSESWRGVAEKWQDRAKQWEKIAMDYQSVVELHKARSWPQRRDRTTGDA